MSEKEGGQEPNLDDKTLSDEELEEVDVVEKDAYLGQRTRAEKAEAKTKELETALEEANKKDPEKKEEKKPNEKGEEDKESGLSFKDVTKISNLTKELSEEELEAFYLEAEKLGVKPEDFIMSDSWKARLGSIRAEEQEANKTPNAKSRVVVHNNKTYDEIMADEKSTKEDKEAGLQSILAKNKK